MLINNINQNNTLKILKTIYQYYPELYLNLQNNWINNIQKNQYKITIIRSLKNKIYKINKAK